MDHSPDALICSGHCYAFFAFDMGTAINLEECDEIIKDATERTRLRKHKKAPLHFDYQPPPLRITQQGTAIEHECFTANQAVEITVFDFGAVSVCYEIDFSCPLSELVPISAEIYGSDLLFRDARQRVDQLATHIKGAIKKPINSPLVEDYVLYAVERINPEIDLDLFWSNYSATIAQILRSETSPLSPDEINDALACRISYSTKDTVAIDWNAALIIDEDTEDLRALLEFGNIELLETRFLDDQLDIALEEAYRGLTSGEKLPARLRKVAELQVESAMQFESVNNALKLTGDQYLARVYSLVTKRFHLADWDGSIIRKLAALDSIYNKISDQADQRRSEFLEWVIIALIAFEIVYTLWESLR